MSSLEREEARGGCLDRRARLAHRRAHALPKRRDEQPAGVDVRVGLALPHRRRVQRERLHGRVVHRRVRVVGERAEDRLHYLSQRRLRRVVDRECQEILPHDCAVVVRRRPQAEVVGVHQFEKRHLGLRHAERRQRVEQRRRLRDRAVRASARRQGRHEVGGDLDLGRHGPQKLHQLLRDPVRPDRFRRTGVCQQRLREEEHRHTVDIATARGRLQNHARHNRQRLCGGTEAGADDQQGGVQREMSDAFMGHPRRRVRAHRLTVAFSARLDVLEWRLRPLLPFVEPQMFGRVRVDAPAGDADGVLQQLQVLRPRRTLPEREGAREQQQHFVVRGHVVPHDESRPHGQGSLSAVLRVQGAVLQRHDDHVDVRDAATALQRGHQVQHHLALAVAEHGTQGESVDDERVRRGGADDRFDVQL
mmetsp:Transcript_31591/g.97609  ORF Transcript_31591/g.97609 Transcript_31591/m.97609 type:complete len:419 (-) Transcript_31591:1414-2670(-)